MQTINDPRLSTKQLADGLSANAITKRKAALVTNGMGPDAAEKAAIDAEQMQAHHNGEDGIRASVDVSSTLPAEDLPAEAPAAPQEAPAEPPAATTEETPADAEPPAAH